MTKKRQNNLNSVFLPRVVYWRNKKSFQCVFGLCYEEIIKCDILIHLSNINKNKTIGINSTNTLLLQAIERKKNIHTNNRDHKVSKPELFLYIYHSDLILLCVWVFVNEQWSILCAWNSHVYWILMCEWSSSNAFKCVDRFTEWLAIDCLLPTYCALRSIESMVKRVYFSCTVWQKSIDNSLCI